MGPNFRKQLGTVLCWDGEDSLENRAAIEDDVSIVGEKLRKRIIEMMRNDRIRPGTCPIDVSYNGEEFLVLINCSSSETRIVDNPHRADASVDAEELKAGRCKKSGFLFLRRCEKPRA